MKMQRWFRKQYSSLGKKSRKNGIKHQVEYLNRSVSSSNRCNLLSSNANFAHLGKKEDLFCPLNSGSQTTMHTISFFKIALTILRQGTVLQELDTIINAARSADKSILCKSTDINHRIRHKMMALDQNNKPKERIADHDDWEVSTHPLECGNFPDKIIKTKKCEPPIFHMLDHHGWTDNSMKNQMKETHSHKKSPETIN